MQIMLVMRYWSENTSGDKIMRRNYSGCIWVKSIIPPPWLQQSKFGLKLFVLT